MQFLDANVLAYAFYNNTRQDHAQDALRKKAITNTLAIIECFQVLERITTRENATKAVRALLRQDLTIVDVDNVIMFEALRQAPHNALSFSDLIHYTTALMMDCTAVCSYDKDFDGLTVPRREP